MSTEVINAIGTERSVVIARANDEFRAAGWGVSLTPGVQALEDLGGLMRTVREFADFTDENDPYGEHDFGSNRQKRGGDLAVLYPLALHN